MRCILNHKACTLSTSIYVNTAHLMNSRINSRHNGRHTGFFANICRHLTGVNCICVRYAACRQVQYSKPISVVNETHSWSIRQRPVANRWPKAGAFALMLPPAHGAMDGVRLLMPANCPAMIGSRRAVASYFDPILIVIPTSAAIAFRPCAHCHLGGLSCDDCPTCRRRPCACCLPSAHGLGQGQSTLSQISRLPHDRLKSART